MSGPNVPLIYLDSCIFIAWFGNEGPERGRTPEDQTALAELFQDVDDSKVFIATSTISFAEVLEVKVPDRAKLIALQGRRNFRIYNVTFEVAELAHELRNYYQNPALCGDNLRTLTTPDAIQLATAILYECDYVYTFDGIAKKKPRERLLLRLKNPIGGKYTIQIQKPLPRPEPPVIIDPNLALNLFEGVDSGDEVPNDATAGS